MQGISENLAAIMGGSSSGRYRTRNRGSVDASCRIDLRFLRKQGAFKEGRSTSGTLRWTRHGTETGSVGYVVTLSPDDRHIAIIYSYKGESQRQVIRLQAVPMRFGGFRYYAFCPRWGRRCEVLPIVGGVIACRQFHKLTYASQSMDLLGRLREKAERCEKQLRQRPRRGANRRRLVDAWVKADCEFEEHFTRETLRRFGHLF